MWSILRTNSDHQDFKTLTIQLDQDLAIKNGDINDFFAQYNKIELIKHVVIVYINDEAVGCGALKEYEESTIEIKRMFVSIEQRGNGIAGTILKELEHWAKELDYKRCILETGDKMIEAIGLYKKHAFTIIPNYGQYTGIASSICFEKNI